MKSKPQISVIVPVYKVEPYLLRCVDSILAQTFTNFELILVDDGSPDNCGVICDEYAAKDERIHVIHQANGGLSAARNAGIDWTFANSDSRWLSFIDSDDWVHPCFLEYLYRAVKESRTKVSVCNYILVADQVLGYPELHYSCRVEKWDLFYSVDGGRGVIACNKLYAKELFDGLRYPVGRVHEDEFLTYKVLDRAQEVSEIDSELYYYFQNQKGITGSAFSLRRLDAVIALREQCLFAKKKGLMVFYFSRMKSRMRLVLRCYNACKQSNSISEAERQRAIRFLRKDLREILLSEGKRIAPFHEFRWCYEIAFPSLAWLYWTSAGIVDKIRRFGK